MNEATDRSPLAVLHQRFGFPAFRPGQEEIVRAALAGRDVLAVMPTGGGKSIGFILPALLQDAPALVVSPLIALMKDQVDALTERGIPASYVNSTVAPGEQEERIARFRAGALRLLYVAPERFKNERFLAAAGGFRPGLFAVDEAHCIAEWGHDFRPDYLKLGEAARRLGRPPIVALTATATSEVREQIARNLGLERPLVLVKGFERPNLDFAVEPIRSRDEKQRRTLALVQAGGRGLVYAATRKSVETLALALRDAGQKAGFYHAGLRDHERRAVQERFASGALPVVVATNAFGMGIDRPDLRFVIHHDLPGSVEAYTQEAGRAGRDGLPAACTLLYGAADARLQSFFIETAYPGPALVEDVFRRLCDLVEDGAAAEAALLARSPGGVHPRAVESALRILEEHGLAARGFARATGEKEVRLVSTSAQDLARIDFAELERRAEREFLRLRLMIDYAERARCQRAYLVDYFAGAGTAQACGACSACRKRGTKRSLTPGEASVVRTLLDLVRSLDGRYGRRRLVQLLKGSRGRTISESGLDRHPLHGTLSHLPEAFLDQLVNECVTDRLLAVDGGTYPVIGITRAGREALSGGALPELACFGERKERKRKCAGGTAPAPVRPPHSPAAGSTAAPGEPGAILLDRLKAWRNARAQKDGVPAYVVMSNHTLAELARLRPERLSQLDQVSGIGPKRTERYGAELIAVLKEKA